MPLKGADDEEMNVLDFGRLEVEDEAHAEWGKEEEVPKWDLAS